MTLILPILGCARADGLAKASEPAQVTREALDRGAKMIPEDVKESVASLLKAAVPEADAKRLDSALGITLVKSGEGAEPQGGTIRSYEFVSASYSLTFSELTDSGRPPFVAAYLHPSKCISQNDVKLAAIKGGWSDIQLYTDSSSQGFTAMKHSLQLLVSADNGLGRDRLISDEEAKQHQQTFASLADCTREITVIISPDRLR